MDLEAFDHPETTSARFCWRRFCSRGGAGNVLSMEIGGEPKRCFGGEKRVEIKKQGAPDDALGLAQSIEVLDKASLHPQQPGPQPGEPSGAGGQQGPQLLVAISLAQSFRIKLESNRIAFCSSKMIHREQRRMI